MFSARKHSVTSPFDEAASRPFLDEPVKKRFSWIKKASVAVCSSLRTAATEESESYDLSSGEFSVEYRDEEQQQQQQQEQYEAPTIKMVDTDSVDLESQEGSSLRRTGHSSSSTSSTDSSDCQAMDPCYETHGAEEDDEEDMEVVALLEHSHGVDLDMAVLQERHSDLTEIRNSMQQINEIQKDIANVVESQSDDIRRFEYLAIEASDHASAGLDHLMAIYNRREWHESLSKQIAKYILGLVALLFLYSMLV